MLHDLVHKCIFDEFLGLQKQIEAFENNSPAVNAERTKNVKINSIHTYLHRSSDVRVQNYYLIKLNYFIPYFSTHTHMLNNYLFYLSRS